MTAFMRPSTPRAPSQSSGARCAQGERGESLRLGPTLLGLDVGGLPVLHPRDVERDDDGVALGEAFDDLGVVPVREADLDVALLDALVGDEEDVEALVVLVHGLPQD